MAATHDTTQGAPLHEALKLAARGYVLETGRVTLTGSGAELAADRRVRDAYLGDG